MKAGAPETETPHKENGLKQSGRGTWGGRGLSGPVFIMENDGGTGDFFVRQS